MAVGWSNDGQIYYTNGYGYGLDENLNSICLGKREDIEEYFRTGEYCSLNDLAKGHAMSSGKFELDYKQTVKDVLSSILKYREEEGYGNIPNNLVRASNDGTIRSNKATTVRIASRKKLSSRSSKQKSQNLPSRRGLRMDAQRHK